MRKLLILGSLMASLLPTASRAQFQLGARVGYASATGAVAKDTARDMSMKALALKSQIPLQLDASYAITNDVAVGAYFSYGFGQTDKSLYSSIEGQSVCDRSDFSCSGTSMRFGVQGLYTLSQVKAVLVPWAGISLGYETSKTEVRGPGGKGTVDLNGFELALQAGGDYPVTDTFAIGLYVQFSIGQFQNGDIMFNGTTMVGGNIDPKAMHEWFGLGLRGKFDI
jgi:outer membrane protein W